MVAYFIPYTILSVEQINNPVDGNDAMNRVWGQFFGTTGMCFRVRVRVYVMYVDLTPLLKSLLKITGYELYWSWSSG